MKFLLGVITLLTINMSFACDPTSKGLAKVSVDLAVDKIGEYEVIKKITYDARKSHVVVEVEASGACNAFGFLIEDVTGMCTYEAKPDGAIRLCSDL